MFRHLFSSGFCLAALLLSACSTLVGNVAPVDEKSDDYRVLDLERDRPGVWKKLPQDPKLAESTDSSDHSDVVFQTQDLSSIVSLNSACREIPADPEKLPDVAQELTLGFLNVEESTDRWMEVRGRKALERTISGKLEGKVTKLRVVVLAVGTCYYDFSYISSPKNFASYESDFSRFVKSLNIR